MRLIKLIVPAALIAVLALFAPHADAQTMGEYASTTAGVGTAGGSMGTSISPSIGSSDIGGGSSTWGASGLGASFDERAGAASAAGMGADFESRAGSSASESRWPGSSLGADTSSRFGGSSGRFPDQNRFTERSEMSSSPDRFPARSFSDNRQGLDTSYNAINN
jgi:hypothetical protein